MLPDIDLNLLRVFDAMMRTGNTTLAASSLRMSQPAISNALKKLRVAFSDPLFVLGSGAMRPTFRAEQIAEDVREALLQVQIALDDRDRFVPGESNRTFRIYLSDFAQFIFLPPLLDRLRVEAPNIRLETLEAQPKDVKNMLEQGEIDLAVGYLNPIGSDFQQQSLVHEHLVCMARVGHPTIRDRLTVENFLQARHIVYRPKVRTGVSFDEEVERMCAARGIQRNVALTIAYALGVGRLVANSDYIATVPSHLASIYSDYSEIQVFELPFTSFSFHVVQQWHIRMNDDPGHAWIRECMAGLIANATNSHALVKEPIAY